MKIAPYSATTNPFASLKIEAATLQEQIYRRLQYALLTGGFEPGQQLVLRTLAEQFGTGTMPLREAVQRLAAEGALRVYPNRSVTVPVLSSKSFEELTAIRIQLEGMAAATAAKKLTDEHITKLTALNKEFVTLAKSGTPEEVLTVNMNFHFLIYGEASVEHLLPIIETLWLRSAPLLVVPLRTRREERSKFLRKTNRHRELIAAFKRRSAREARKVMQEIIEGSADWYRKNYRFSDRPAPESGSTRQAS